MSQKFVGREEELKILEAAVATDGADMISVVGRRRVGKTYLIRSFFEGKMDFDMTGIQNAPLRDQLKNFAFQLMKAKGDTTPEAPPKSWLEAFQTLILYLETLKPKKKKKIIFLDELPWLATRRSGFLRNLGFFWNSWAAQQNIIVIICGSAASWMIQKVVNNKGGLHNRITKRLHLQPFTLKETKQFLESRKVNLNHHQIVQLYMAIGGIPHYLMEATPGNSASQIIDQSCFSSKGLLRNEFSRLYQALFEFSDNHIQVARTLAKKHNGLTRQQLIDAAKLPNGGGTTKLMKELLHSGFITGYLPFGKKKKDTLYRLSDEYSLFYLRFIEPNSQEGAGTWLRLEQTAKYKVWSGYAYENICLKHVYQLKKALGITGVYSVSGSFIKQGEDGAKGTQIDLLIDRNDQTINLVEVKFHKTKFTVNKSYAENLRDKMAIFQETTKTRKQLFLTLVSTFGLMPNKHSIGLITSSITMDDLFV